MIKLSLIIVSYNTRYFLKKCLESIIINTSKDFKYEVIIVDNASVDGSIEEVKKLQSKNKNDNLEIKIVENIENLGFAKANNIAVKEAKGNYLLFLNSDTELLYKHTLEEMVAFMDHHPKAGAATCTVELPDKTIDDASHRGFPTPWNAICHFIGLGKIFPSSDVFNGYHMAWKNIQNVHEIDALAGAFMIVRKDAGINVGWWDEDYFFYGEDLDFCYKLKEKGWKVYFVPSTKILHYKGVSSGIKEHSINITTASIELQRRITHARFEAMKIFYRKHYIRKYPSFLTEFVMKGISLKEWMTLRKI
jgi:GT2 family glycosyltransferase